jgi:hypothetical protein
MRWRELQHPLQSWCATALLLAAGCAQQLAHDLPDGRHVISATASSGGYVVSRETARDEAGEYCARSRQQPVIDSFEDLAADGLDAPHTSRVFFTCAAP